VFQGEDQEAAGLPSSARAENTVSTESVAMGGYGRLYDRLIV